MLNIVNQNILEHRTAERAKLKGAAIGDFIKRLDGSIRRFTHDWGDGIQVTPENVSGSFYLLSNGGGEYSGSLDPSIAKENFFLTDEKRLGKFWFFSNNEARAHNGVYVEIECRVYQEKESNK